MKIAVLGAGGFIGSHLVKALSDNGHHIKALDINDLKDTKVPSGLNNLEWIKGDLRNNDDITSVVKDAEIVMHLAHATNPATSSLDPLSDTYENIDMNIKILDVLVKEGIQKIVYISSGGCVYGEAQYTPIDEKHETNPIVPYGISKLAIEKFFLMYKERYGIKPLILRLSNPYGKYAGINTAQGAVDVFLHKVRNEQPIEIWGDGSISRDYLFIEDLIDALIKAAKYQGSKSVINTGSGIETSLNNLIDIIAEVTGVLPIVRYKQHRHFDVSRNVLCNKLADKELGWKPTTDIRTGIQKVIKMYGDSPGN